VKAARRLLGREPTEADMEPFSLGMARLVQTVPDAEIGAAVRRLAGVAARYEAWFADYDVILSPVLRSPPVPLGHVRGDVAFQELSDRLTAYVGYTPLHNVAGAPAMSVPLHWTADGLPVGSHFAAKTGDERTLFELAYELEAARPWAGRKPPVSA
jgi:amidase